MKLLEKRVDVTFSRHKPTGLWSAHSDDLDGLMIFGQTAEELHERLAPAIRALLEADGHSVASVEEDETADAGWSLPNTASVEIRFAA